MAHGKDIDLKKIYIFGGIGILVSVAVGAFFVAPMIEKMKEKNKETSKLLEKKKPVLKKTA